jgi:hypothetical protein
LAALVEAAEDVHSDPVQDVHRVLELQHAYEEAVDQELALYAAGRDRAAEEVDEEVVDPAFDALADAMASEGREQAAYGRTARRLSDVGLVIGVVLALLAGWVWRSGVRVAWTFAGRPSVVERAGTGC